MYNNGNCDVSVKPSNLVMNLRNGERSNELGMVEEEKFRIISYNIAGLKNKLIFPSFFAFVKESDIFCLFETHITDKDYKNYEKYFGGYVLCWVYATRSSTFGRASGGWLLGIRSHYVHKGICSFFWVDNYPCIQLNMYSDSTILVPAYINCSKWEPDFNSFVNCLGNFGNAEVIILGDFNVRLGDNQTFPDELYLGSNIRNWRCSVDHVVSGQGRRFLEICDDFGLCILNGRTKGDLEGNLTYVGGNGTSVNDVIAASISLLARVDWFEVGGQSFSDHFPLVLSLNSIVSSSVRGEKDMKLLPKLNWKLQNINEYQMKIDHLCLEVSEGNVDHDIDSLLDIIKQSARSVSVNTKCVLKQKWYDWECLRARKLSFKWLNIFRKSHSSVARSYYVSANKSYKLLCIKKRQTYYESLARRIDSVRDTKSWWGIAREIQGKKFVVNSNIDVSVFMNHFQSLLNYHSDRDLILYTAPYTEDVTLDGVIEMSELTEVLRKLKDNKAPGIDRVPYEFFKYAPETFISKLLSVFNRIFETREIPKSFKDAIIFPLHKKGAPEHVENYRGLSFMNSVAKIFVGIIYNRLSKWEKNHAILSESQAGFRPGYSTTDNIFNLISIIKIAQSLKIKKIYAFFIDFKSAFDTVDRHSLIYKLFNCGISYKMVKLIEGLYENTQAQVWDGENVSGSFATLSGVKQGCVLSPLLFALYINDLEMCLETGIKLGDISIKLLMYADDIVILSDDPIRLQRMICSLESYCSLWRLDLNLNKSKIVIFQLGGGVRRSSENWKYCGRPIEVVNKYTYLGIELTQKLSMNGHLKKRLQSAKITLNCTWRQFLGRNDINHSEKYKLFNAISRAVLCYGAQIWGFTLYEDVEKLQRFFLKRLFNLPTVTPNYALTIETDLSHLYIYTLKCHFLYMLKVLYKYESHRLPHRLAWLMVGKKLHWYEKWCELAEKHDSILDLETVSQCVIKANLFDILEAEDTWLKEQAKCRARTTVRHELYDKLDYVNAHNYFKNNLTIKQIGLIMRYRCGLVTLNGSPWRKEGSNLCSLCNLMEEESLLHFLAICPILTEFRVQAFGKKALTEREVIEILNGKNEYSDLLRFGDKAWKYRQLLINEYNP